MKEREEPEIFLGVYPKKVSLKFVPFSNREKSMKGTFFEESLLLDIQVLKLNRLLDPFDWNSGEILGAELLVISIEVTLKIYRHLRLSKERV